MLNVTITYDDINKCSKFSNEIINSNNQYNRFQKNQYIQFERTFVGKLGEIAFLKHLLSKRIKVDYDSMFLIFKASTPVLSFWLVVNMVGNVFSLS